MRWADRAIVHFGKQFQEHSTWAVSHKPLYQKVNAKPQNLATFNLTTFTALIESTDAYRNNSMGSTITPFIAGHTHFFQSVNFQPSVTSAAYTDGCHADWVATLLNAVPSSENGNITLATQTVEPGKAGVVSLVAGTGGVDLDRSMIYDLGASVAKTDRSASQVYTMGNTGFLSLESKSPKGRAWMGGFVPVVAQGQNTQTVPCNFPATCDGEPVCGSMLLAPTVDVDPMAPESPSIETGGSGSPSPPAGPRPSVPQTSGSPSVSQLVPFFVGLVTCALLTVFQL